MAEPMPPVIVIDERTMKSAVDVGPVCECRQRCLAVAAYAPYLPGTPSPYLKKTVPDSESFEVRWKNRPLGPKSLDPAEAVAYRCVNPSPLRRSRELEELFFIKPSVALRDNEHHVPITPKSEELQS